MKSNRDIATHEFSGDVVIVGAGPLGIVLALELAGDGHRVLLLESGGRRYKPDVQSLSDEASDGADPFHVAKRLAVRRQLGGTSATWGGRCVPFDPIDFQQRPIQPNPLWPVSHHEIAAFIPRACEWCCCGAAVFDARDVPTLRDQAMISGLPDDEVSSTTLERWSLPTRFWDTYGRRVRNHPLVHLVPDMTCVEIVTTPNGSAVEHLELRTVAGGRATARGQNFVIAAGGLESTRLLMASDRHHPRGIGSHSGHLGRWYMAHVDAKVARMRVRSSLKVVYGFERDEEDVYVRRRFTFSENVLRGSVTPNAAIWIINPEIGDASHRSGILSSVYLTLRSPVGGLLIAEGLRQIVTRTRVAPSSVPAHLRNVVRQPLRSVVFGASFAYKRYFRPGRKVPGFFVAGHGNVFPLEYHGEHLPHWTSHVSLSNERDALGLRRLRTSLFFSPEDIRSVRNCFDRLDRHLRRNRAGTIEYESDDVDTLVRDQLRGSAGYHQTGTTRMSRSPMDGVVDPALKVHGLSNLYVASTSVFPTSSQANPTLTGVAFAVRLAKHLHQDLGA